MCLRLKEIVVRFTFAEAHHESHIVLPRGGVPERYMPWPRV